jgi:hypothetical protein
MKLIFLSFLLVNTGCTTLMNPTMIDLAVETVQQLADVDKCIQIGDSNTCDVGVAQ